MKITISSDNHLDVNRQDPDEIMIFQHKHLYIKDLLNKHLKSAYFLHTLRKFKKNVSKKRHLASTIYNSRNKVSYVF